VALFEAIDGNKGVLKMLAGGDTLQELRTLRPGQYMAALDDPGYYFFSGGGTILTAVQQGSAADLEPVRALIEASDARPCPPATKY